MPYHRVVYTHDCPVLRKAGRASLQLLIIEYDDAEHEALNLRTQKEHVCRRCGQSRNRLGRAVEVVQAGAISEYIDENWLEAQSQELQA